MAKQFLRGQQVSVNGAPTDAFLEWAQGLVREVNALNAKLEAISQVVAPTGGATVDAEARAAIVGIINAA